MALDLKENQDKLVDQHKEEEDDSCFFSAMLGCFTQIHSATLNFAIEYKLFDIIAKANGRHVSATEVASQLPTSIQHQDLAFRLDRVLRLLATHSYLTCSYGVNSGGDNHIRETLYGISPVGKFFVSANQNTTGFLALTSSLIGHPTVVGAWLNFKNAIIDKETVDIYKKVHGMPFYQFAEIDPTLNNLINKSMENLSFIAMRKILEIYKGFEGISTLVDVGGGTAQTLKMILSKYPSIKAINFDLPQVIQNAPPHPGIEHVEGDMFESVPKGDAIILKLICHNWSDENCIKILSKCYKALPENGKVLVLETIVGDIVEQSEEAKLSSRLDITMFLQGGRERTEKEFEYLCKCSGFSGIKVACCAFDLRVIEFYK
ncbi:isoliquiritigenin 2'-O-methyltransferase-like [Senna tora]|uniref:Isoliquiritigenin 2'-O-methyltransferase-like n=1 Tax=Senna tora TaxID=362788 RepID=A0A834X0R4_9FABA|nr:isoliquiritigenin 2'-O-methyltransferase-like [Senna tora]